MHAAAQSGITDCPIMSRDAAGAGYDMLACVLALRVKHGELKEQNEQGLIKQHNSMAPGRQTAYGMSRESYLRSISKGRASRRAKSHQTMTQANSRAVDRKSTMFQADLKYARKDPCTDMDLAILQYSYFG